MFYCRIYFLYDDGAIVRMISNNVIKILMVETQTRLLLDDRAALSWAKRAKFRINVKQSKNGPVEAAVTQQEREEHN